MRKIKIDLDAEGVVHYQLRWKKSPALPAALVREINRWRGLFYEMEWIGQAPQRYRGVGFGNVSRRYGRRFIVSGTQTGRLPTLSARHYAVVTKTVPEKNRVEARGPVPPSSESMTHAVIYAHDPSARVVIHVHAPVLWKNAKKLGLLQTPARVPYGTPAMAAAVKRLLQSGSLRKTRIFAMAGHRDGVVSYGRTADEAGFRLIYTLAKIS